MAEMKSLNGYEIVDQTARNNINYLKTKDYSRNLLLRSGTFTGNWYNYSYWTYDSMLNGLAIVKRSDLYMGLCQKIYVTAGETYTYSVYVKTTGNIQVNLWPHCGVDERNLSAGYEWDSYIGEQANDGFTRRYIVIKITSTGIIRPGAEISSGAGTLYLYAPKLEHGSTLTVWSPAPEDAVGGQILSGSTPPANSYGINGDFYVMY